MIIEKAFNVKGYVTPAPYERLIKVLVSPETHPIKNIAVGMVIIPPGKETFNHSHDNHEETWYIVSGRGKVIVGGETREVVADTVIVVPENCDHRLINTGDESLKVLWVYTPPGYEKTVLEQKFK